MNSTPETSNSILGDPDAPIPARIQDGLDNLAQLNERALAIIRERPLTCVLGALALGFIVGKIAVRF